MEKSVFHALAEFSLIADCAWPMQPVDNEWADWTSPGGGRWTSAGWQL